MLKNTKATELSKKILLKNKNLFERLKYSDLEKTYLYNDDVFLISIGKPVKKYNSIETEDGLITIHYGDNLKITGFTIPYVQEFLSYCSKIFSKDEQNKTQEVISEKTNSQTLTNAAMHYFLCSMPQLPQNKF
jgi:hypothetical protein